MAGVGSPVAVRSLGEICLYLELARCPSCGGGPLRAAHEEISADPAQEVLKVPATCARCGAVALWRFDVRGQQLPEPLRAAFAAWAAGKLSVINPTDTPSGAIDLAGWLTLYGRFEGQARQAAEAAATLRDREAARRLQMRAVACLDEALKFYDADNDLPPEEAFFVEGSLEQYRERPDLFAWDRLIELRGRLPR